MVMTQFRRHSKCSANGNIISRCSAKWELLFILSSFSYLFHNDAGKGHPSFPASAKDLQEPSKRRENSTSG